MLSNLQASLLSPQSRIPKQLFEAEAGMLELEPTEFATCEAYKLFRNTGKLINLADWYGAFQLSVQDQQETSPQKSRGKRKRAEENENELKEQQELRFMGAVADLAYLGFVQPNKRKIEHVARNVF